MKRPTSRHKLLLIITLVLLTIPSLFANNDPGIEKKKTYTKSYPLAATEKVRINNQFGEVKIATWDKKEVSVTVTITVKANTEEDAQAILDHINIEDGRTGDGVFFKTNMRGHGGEGNRGDKKGSKSTSMEINYEVSMPAANPLSLENQFGKTVVPDMQGVVDITQKFGDLVAGNLANVKDLHVEFGSAVVESLNNCKVIVKFSKAEIKKISGDVKGNFEFCDKIKLSLNNALTGLNIVNSYSKIEMAVANEFNGDFDIHTNFGDFINNTSLPIKEQRDDDDHGPKFDKDYSGKSGSGACKVKIKSSFGTIRFN